MPIQLGNGLEIFVSKSLLKSNLPYRVIMRLTWKRTIKLPEGTGYKCNGFNDTNGHWGICYWKNELIPSHRQQRHQTAQLTVL